MQNGNPDYGWRKFAVRNNLTFKPYIFFLRDAYVVGNYHGYRVRLESFSRTKYITPSRSVGDRDSYTRMTLGTNKTSYFSNDKAFNRELDAENVVSFLFPSIAQDLVKGRFYAFETGREITYEQKNTETDAEYLQFVLGTLLELIEAYPRVVDMGGEVVPILHPISKKYHILQHVAGQLIFDIGRDTEKRLKGQETQLLCPHCLVHCGAHQRKVGWIGDVTYYGCRTCGQSRNFVPSENYHLVVLLDSELTAEQINYNETIRINWIKYRKLFDFEEVEIVRATDEDAERFAVQVGNDTDPFRSTRYKQMCCTISADCGLSENTIRILRQMFGQVEVVAKSYQTLTGGT
jgi:hypothetical protein